MRTCERYLWHIRCVLSEEHRGTEVHVQFIGFCGLLESVLSRSPLGEFTLLRVTQWTKAGEDA